MTTAYDDPLSTSTRVPLGKWRLALAALVLVAVGGAFLTTALALGAADPACARVEPLLIDLNADAVPIAQADAIAYYTPEASVGTPFLASGATLFAITAHSRSQPGSAWGVWIDTADGRFAALVTRDGYLSTGYAGVFDWREFPHVNTIENTICLDISAEGAATVYANREVAWRGHLNVSADVAWGWAANTNSGL